MSNSSRCEGERTSKAPPLCEQRKLGLSSHRLGTLLSTSTDVYKNMHTTLRCLPPKPRPSIQTCFPEVTDMFKCDFGDDRCFDLFLPLSNKIIRTIGVGLGFYFALFYDLFCSSEKGSLAKASLKLTAELRVTLNFDPPVPTCTGSRLQECTRHALCTQWVHAC